MTTASKTSTRDQGVSMLDAMVAGTFQQKAAKAMAPKGTLTPLPAEANVPLVGAPAPIPNHPVLGNLGDDPDIIIGRLNDARAQAVEVVASIDRLLTMWGRPAEALAQAIEVEATLTEKEKARRAADEATAQSAGPNASKADQKKAERAAARVAATKATDPAEASAAHVNDKAELLKQMMAAEPEEVEAINRAIENFPAEFAAKKAAAEAAVYTTPVIEAATTAAAEPDATPQSIMAAAMAADQGWVCPQHGGFKEKTSAARKVVFRVCAEPGCNQFEKK